MQILKRIYLFYFVFRHEKQIFGAKCYHFTLYDAKELIFNYLMIVNFYGKIDEWVIIYSLKQLMFQDEISITNNFHIHRREKKKKKEKI